MRVLCWTEGGCSGEKVGGIRSAAGLMFGCAAGSIFVDRLELPSDSLREMYDYHSEGQREYLADDIDECFAATTADRGGCADANPRDISLK